MNVELKYEYVLQYLHILDELQQNNRRFPYRGLQYNYIWEYLRLYFGDAPPGCAKKQTARLPPGGPAPLRSVCAITSLCWLLLCCKAGRQAEQLQRDQAKLTTTEEARALGKVKKRNTFLILWFSRVTVTPRRSSCIFTHAWEYIFRSVDLKWLPVAASSQCLLRGLLSCGLSVVAEPVAWSSPEEAPLRWMDLSEHGAGLRVLMRTVVMLGFHRQRVNWSWMFGLHRPYTKHFLIRQHLYSLKTGRLWSSLWR